MYRLLHADLSYDGTTSGRVDEKDLAIVEVHLPGLAWAVL